MVDREVERWQQRALLLEKQYAELAQIAGSLAHEIKNPLSVIRMNMELVEEDLEESETPRERRVWTKLQTVHSQCQRLEKLLNDFMKFARLRDLELEIGSLNRQIISVLDMYEAQAQTQSVQMNRYLDPELPAMQLDQETLQGALANLVKNALESMQDGGELTAITRVTPVGIAMDLIDTGCGMSDNTALNMFNAFYTTKPAGSGLGLPMARKVVQAHGGRIDVQSQEEQGTKFTLEFPTPARLD
ncbi:MAG: sensor histidine kinase [Planctomycetaceae bacterium]|jgi:signal transduction histidine kinase|nr:sensor histidine kinase [Planctomycetaceae bacterium]MDB4863878.1 ATP-binding protein [Pirellulaceae bacterium]